jgi:hypothetical protein
MKQTLQAHISREGRGDVRVWLIFIINTDIKQN